MTLDPATLRYDLLPASLDDIIRTNRDQTELRLSSTQEIDALVGKIEIALDAKDEINNWRLISLVDKASKVAQVLLLGDSRAQRHPGITSPVLTIDFEQGIAITRSKSVYKLGDRGYGEPPQPDLYCLCAAMHSWGKGIALGVPQFSY